MISLRTYEMEEILRNEELRKAARRLTLDPYSGMNVALNLFQSKLDAGCSIDAKGIFAFKGEWAVGWCLLTREGDGKSFAPKDGFACVQIFVDPDFRREGIGSTMLKEVTAIYPGATINCYGWCNTLFFDSFIKQGNFQSL